MNRCPKCGARLAVTGSGYSFYCGTWIASDDVTTVEEGRDCVRDQLAAWKAYAERLEVAGFKMTELLECYAGFSETEAWACSTRPQHIRETRLATEEWTKAKEAKP